MVFDGCSFNTVSNIRNYCGICLVAILGDEMEEIYNDYRKFASIGLTHDQIKDCLVIVRAYTYHEIEQAQAYVSHPQHSGANVDMNVSRKQHGENYWVEKPSMNKEWPDCEPKQQWDHSINEASAQDWDAVRPSPLQQQVGGDWYTKLAIQPAEYATANKMTFLEGLILKYISRWRNKDGVKDLRKIQQTVDLIIHLEKL